MKWLPALLLGSAGFLAAVPSFAQDSFLVALQDTTGSGHADINKRFGDTVQTGSAGGTGIWIYKDALYVEMNDRILRYAGVSPGAPGRCPNGSFI